MSKGEQAADSAMKRASPDRAAKTRIWGVRRWAEVSFLVTGVCLLAFFVAARVESYIASHSVLETYSSVEATTPSSTDEIVAGNTAEKAVAEDPDFSLWNEVRIRGYTAAIPKRSGVPLAILKIPSIRLVAPLFDGTDSVTLNHAVGRIAGTAWPGEPGNMGIAGHRDGFFRGLKDVKQGDAIQLRTPRGTEIYTIDQIRIVEPHDVTVLQPQSVPSVTLVTCYPFYFIGSAPKRFVVTASLTQHAAVGTTTTESRLLNQ